MKLNESEIIILSVSHISSHVYLTSAHISFKCHIICYTNHSTFLCAR